jgi:hypothetical protein
MNDFFASSNDLDREVLRPLSHIRSNWETTWDRETEAYKEEDESFAGLLNALIAEIDGVRPPARYHDNEDRLAEYVRDRLKWPIYKSGNRWVGADYGSIIQQGGFDDLDEQDLIKAAAGRIRAAIVRGQRHYDQMEDSHRAILATVLSVILYHRDTPERWIAEQKAGG